MKVIVAAVVYPKHHQKNGGLKKLTIKNWKLKERNRDKIAQ